MNNPIFIIGSARSGTVLVGSILKSHPNIHCLIERTDVFDFASKIALNPELKKTNSQHREKIKKELKHLYENAWEINRKNCSNCSKICRKKGDIQSRFYRYTGILIYSCERNNKIMRYADKSHQHLLNVDLLNEIFPDSQYIHVIRDGRDVVSSMVNHKGVKSWFNEAYINEESHFPNPWFGIENRNEFENWKHMTIEEKCALRWKSWVKEGSRARKLINNHNRWLEIKYENLIRDREKALNNIFDFINVPNIDLNSPDMYSSSISIWKKRLTSNQINSVIPLIKDQLVANGYNV